MGVKNSQEYATAFSPVLLAFRSLLLNLRPSFSFWMSRVPFSALWLTASLELRLIYMPQPSTLLMSPKFLSPEFQIIFFLFLAAQHSSFFVQMIPSNFVLLASTLQTNQKSGSYLRFHTHLIMMILYSKYLSCHCCCQVASVVSDFVRPQRRQPTRLPCPWDFPGKNTGVGCHFLLQCRKVKSESEVAQSCPTLATPWTAAHQAPPSMGFSRQQYSSGVPLPSPLLSLVPFYS